VTPTLEADPKRIEKMLEEDRRTIIEARDRRTQQRRDARKARLAIREAIAVIARASKRS